MHNLEVHVLTNAVKLNKHCRAQELSSFVFSPNLKLTEPTVLFDAIADVTVLVANIQQLKLFLFQTNTRYHWHLRNCTGREGETVCWG